ncbi:hypothetical protein [Fodinibius saliphilus]|uniref:hypothetical protein n=1 Tax=Fodinibius saliphilus TaxID=1920650 RepID=UPI001108CD93|nr:hypothetical protein [Fodinibius saliphilus]
MKKEKSKDRLGNQFRRISADLKLYIEKRIELMMLNTGEYLSGWIAASLHRGAGALLILGGVCFLLFALAIYLGDLLGSDSLGYVLVSLPLLLTGLLFVYLKPDGLFKRLQQMFEAEVIKAINQNGELPQKKLDTTESARSKTQKDD